MGSSYIIGCAYPPRVSTEQGGLRGIFGVLVAQDSPADTPDHRAVTMHEHGERLLLPSTHVTFQKLSVGQARARFFKPSRCQVLNDSPELARCHRACPLRFGL